MVSQNESYCPINCPFLASRVFLPKTMPFYCEKYGTFLGMDAAKKVVKCASCTGKKQDLVAEGLSLLEAQLLPQGQINQMKQAFLMMPATTQKTFVSILSQIGCQLQLEKDQALTPFSLMRIAQRCWFAARRREESPEVQAFIKLLDVVGGGDDPIDGMTKTLLSNLFQVIDGSEKSMLLTIMENPKNLESFLKSFGKTPHDSDLLRNFRALLYETHQHLVGSIGMHFIQEQQNHQMKMEQMRHTIEQMTKARALTMKKSNQRG